MRTILEVSEVFRAWKTNCEDMDNENWFDDSFERALLDLDPKATTGLSVIARWGPTVGQALGFDPLVGYDPARVSALREWTRLRLRRPREADPILVFVKPEPHKKTKVDEGRLRLISAVGFLDTMVDRVMFGWLHRQLLQKVGKTPALIGWSPYKGGYRLLTQAFSGQKAMAMDRSSWDWTVQGWLLLMVKDLIKEFAVGAPQWWHEWLDVRWEVLFRDAEFGFRSGERVKQPGWGVMKSGCYLTLVVNSLAQAIMHSIACQNLDIHPDWNRFFAVGDDTLQSPVNDIEAYQHELEKLGARIKACSVSETLEFCGHFMRGQWMVPAYKEKHIFRVLHAPQEALPATLSAYQLCYACDGDAWGWFSTQLARVAPELHRHRFMGLTFIRG